MCAKQDSALNIITAGKRDFLLKAGFKPKYFCNYTKVLALLFILHVQCACYNVHLILCMCKCTVYIFSCTYYSTKGKNYVHFFDGLLTFLK